VFKLEEQTFVDAILGSLPPIPRYYPRMKELNGRGAPNINALPGVCPLSAEQLSKLLEAEDVVVLDLRRTEAFGGAHVPGAINIGAGQNLSLWAGWMLDPDKRIVLVNETGDDDASRRALVRVGLDRIEGFLSGGMPSWIDAGLDFSRTTQLSTQQVNHLGPETQVIDVRSDSEWNGGHIEGAVHLMLGDLPEHVRALPEDRHLVTVCGSGYRSSIAASLLSRDGFKDVSSMDGGMAAWNRQNLPAS